MRTGEDTKFWLNHLMKREEQEIKLIEQLHARYADALTAVGLDVTSSNMDAIGSYVDRLLSRFKCNQFEEYNLNDIATQVKEDLEQQLKETK